MDTGTEDKLISVREAAKECDRNPETIRRWIWSGKLPAEKLGNQLFIRRSILAAFCREIMVPHQAISEGTPQATSAVEKNIKDGPGGNVDSPPAAGISANRKDLLSKLLVLRQEIMERAGYLDVDRYMEQLRGDM
jgi:excisionase family DNA binding protein